MSFIMLAFLFFLMILLFMKYRKVYSVIVVILSLYSLTTLILVVGLRAYGSETIIMIFQSELPQKEFFHFIAAWFVLDTVSAVIIARNYLKYRMVNKK